MTRTWPTILFLAGLIVTAVLWRPGPSWAAALYGLVLAGVGVVVIERAGRQDRRREREARDRKFARMKR